MKGIQRQADQFSLEHTVRTGYLTGDARFDAISQSLWDLRTQGLSHTQMANRLAKEHYPTPEEQKAFKDGWKESMKPGRDLDVAEQRWGGRSVSDPEVAAWYDGWQTVHENL